MELFQKSQICAVEETDVVNSVAHHNKTVKTDIYVEACVFIGVETCGAEYVGMRCTSGHDLYPAYVLTYAAALSAAYKTSHINFKSGLNKGEEACSHTYGHVSAEYLGEDALYHYLTCCEGKVLINYKRLILEKCSLVTGVRSLVTVNTSGIYKAVRRLVCLHITYRAARKVRTETELVLGLARIVSLFLIGMHALTGRVVGGEVKIVECEVFA